MKRSIIVFMMVITFACNVFAQSVGIEYYLNASKDNILSLVRNGTKINDRFTFRFPDNIIRDGITPFMVISTMTTKFEIADILLANGASTTDRSFDGQTALMLAAKYGRQENIDYLIEKGSDVNATDGLWTSLLISCCWNTNPGIVASLLDADANIEALSGEGLTALCYACNESINSYDTVKILVERGAAIDREYHMSNATILCWASMLCPYPDVIELLIKNGARINYRDSEGMTPLMWAVRGRNISVIKVLLKSGADGTIVSSEGKTAFDYAANDIKLQNTDVYWMLNNARY